MIERVEVLQSGASPLYGSDAVAGVVNIITRRPRKGSRHRRKFGTYRQGDGHTTDLQLSYGHSVAVDRHIAGVRGTYTKPGSGEPPPTARSRCSDRRHHVLRVAISGCSSCHSQCRFDVLGQA